MVVAGLGRDGAAGGPDVRLMIPPALMEQGAYGMNQTVINAQSCAPGQCHPNDAGCAKLAEVVYDGCTGCWSQD